MRGNGTLNGKNRKGRWGRFDRGGRFERCIKLMHRCLCYTAHNSLISGLWVLILKRAEYGGRFVNIIHLCGLMSPDVRVDVSDNSTDVCFRSKEKAYGRRHVCCRCQKNITYGFGRHVCRKAAYRRYALAVRIDGMSGVFFIQVISLSGGEEHPVVHRHAQVVHSCLVGSDVHAASVGQESPDSAVFIEAEYLCLLAV